MEFFNGALNWILLVSAAMFVGSIVVAWIMIVRMPHDYLTRDESTQLRDSGDRNQLVTSIGWVAKNVLGLILLLVGIVMLFTPGQGFMFMFLGVTVMDFPGKHNITTKLLSRPGIVNAINKIRDRAGKPPLSVPSQSAG